MYVAFLDYSKAFDTISHSGLFLKLMDQKVPLCFLLIIMFWYLNMEYNVKWAKVRSNSFPVLCGTKQGGILSPDFFAVYINDLIITPSLDRTVKCKTFIASKLLEKNHEIFSEYW